MRLLLMRHLWGVNGVWEELFPKFKQLGYHGVEAAVPPAADRIRLRELLDMHGLDYIPQIFTAGASVSEHIESFRRQIELAQSLKPRLINAHSGQDAWDESDSALFYEKALVIQAELKASVAHETHRGRVFFNPWITSRMLARFPDLQLCCDFSHWVCVGERLLDDQEMILRQCAQHCRHLHARVGYEQGPQVPDPRAPEYQVHLAAHERWWQTIWDAQSARGDSTTTLTPEFGPPPYQHTLPFTNTPVSDLNAICDWQAARQASNFKQWSEKRGMPAPL